MESCSNQKSVKWNKIYFICEVLQSSYPVLKDTNKKKRHAGPRNTSNGRQSILNQHGYHSIFQWYTLPSGLCLVQLSLVFQQDNDPKCTSRLCKGYLTRKESNGVLHQMTCSPQSHNLNPIDMIWNELDRRVKEKQPIEAYAETPSRLLEKHSRWIWLRECQECAKLSSSQRVATLKNLKYKLHFDLFNTFFGYYMIPCVIS